MVDEGIRSGCGPKSHTNRRSLQPFSIHAPTTPPILWIPPIPFNRAASDHEEYPRWYDHFYLSYFYIPAAWMTAGLLVQQLAYEFPASGGDEPSTGLLTAGNVVVMLSVAMALAGVGIYAYKAFELGFGAITAEAKDRVFMQELSLVPLLLLLCARGAIPLGKLVVSEVLFGFGMFGQLFVAVAAVGFPFGGSSRTDRWFATSLLPSSKQVVCVKGEKGGGGGGGRWRWWK